MQLFLKIEIFPYFYLTFCCNKRSENHVQLSQKKDSMEFKQQAISTDMQRMPNLE